MAFTYTGSPTATQTPSSPPGPGVAPKQTLPSDGDAANVASIAQAFKVLADFIAWLTDMFAIALAFVQPVQRWRNAQLQTRFFVDHNGLPGGKFIRWTEDWTPRTPWNLGTGGAQTVGKWTCNAVGAASSISPSAPGVSAFNPSNSYSTLVMTIDGSSTANRNEVRLSDDSTTANFTDDNQVSVDFDFELSTIIGVDWVIGVATIGELVNGIAHGAFIIRPAGAGGNYICRSIAGGSPTPVDSGVLASAGVPHHLRIEWVGANVSDDSTARFLFYIDGALVTPGGITTTLPNSGTRNVVPIVGGFMTATGANQSMIIGPVTYAQITSI